MSYIKTYSNNFSIRRTLTEFYSRNLFERIVIYVSVSELIVKIIFELLMGKWYFVLAREKQYLLFTLLLLDYIINYKKILNIKISVNYILIFIFIFFIAILQGIFVGIYNGNKIFEIFNDSVPLLLIVGNALRMQSYQENKRDIDFNFLLKFSSLVGMAICLTGGLGVLLHRPSSASVGGLTAGIYFPIFFAALFTNKKITIPYIMCFCIIFGLTLTDLNRTTMAFMGISSIIIIVIKFLHRPFRGLILITSALLCGLIGWGFLPKDSKTYIRIIRISEINTSDHKGSVGERQAEYDAIKTKLKDKGESTQLFGMGHGALYEVKVTHGYMKDYGHAHYSWALFNLRYGLTGYLYLLLLLFTLTLHAYKNIDLNNPAKMTVSLLCFQSILYLATYVNFVFLLSGLQFLVIKKRE